MSVGQRHRSTERQARHPHDRRRVGADPRDLDDAARPMDGSHGPMAEEPRALRCAYRPDGWVQAPRELPMHAPDDALARGSDEALQSTAGMDGRRGTQGRGGSGPRKMPSSFCVLRARRRSCRRRPAPDGHDLQHLQEERTPPLERALASGELSLRDATGVTSSASRSTGGADQRESTR
jgi:hypothetical protein